MVLKLPNLKFLYADYLVFDEDFRAYLNAGPPLVQLSLRKVGLKDDHLQAVAKVKTLVILRLDQNPGITDEGMKYLCQLPNLHDLSIHDCTVTPASIRYLKSIRKLVRIRVPGKLWSAADVARLKSALPQLAVDPL